MPEQNPSVDTSPKAPACITEIRGLTVYGGHGPLTCVRRKSVRLQMMRYRKDLGLLVYSVFRLKLLTLERNSLQLRYFHLTKNRYTPG